MAQDLFQVLDGLQVSDEDIKEAEIFAANYLQPLYPDLDLREGTALRDTAIRASATLIAMIRKGLTYYFTINSLSNATDSTPEETIDSILSNFFLARKEGSNSILRARMYFSIRKDVTISSSSFFSPNNEEFFYPSETYGVPATDLIWDSSKDLYYCDIDVTSQEPGERFNIETGEFLYFSIFDPYFIGSDILYLKQRSIPRESNTSFVERAGSAVSTRNLINSPSIESRIQEEFNTFSNITSVGMGEPEMMRDLVTIRTGTPAQFVPIHIGGHVDVYVQSQIELSEEEFTVNSIQEGVVISDHVGIFDIEPVSLTLDNATVLDGNSFEMHASVDNYDLLGEPTEPMFDLGLSSKQVTNIRISEIGGSFNPAWENATLTLRFRRATGLTSLQSFFDDSLARVLCANLLARSYEIVSLDINIATHTSTSVSAATTFEYVKKYVDGIKPGDPFVTSEMLEVLSRDAGIENIVVPNGTISSGVTGVEYRLSKKNLEVESGVITSIFDPTRLQRFYVNSVSINGVTL